MNQATAVRPDELVVAHAVTIRTRQDGRMYGVISQPAMTTTRPRVVIICGKAGPGDIWRWFADSLALQGLVVLRFDPAGSGDSPGGDEAVDVPVEEYHRTLQAGAFTQDTADAVKWIHDSYHPSEIFLLGPCGICSSLLLAASAVPDMVTGLILVTPAVLYTGSIETMRGHDSAVALRSYARRLLDPNAYRTFLIGRSDYRFLGTVIGSVLRRALALPRQAAARIKPVPGPNHPAFNRHFWDGFRAVMAQRKPILFLLAELDNETADFNAEFKEVVLDRHRDYRKLCAVHMLPKTDHSFLFEDGRRFALDATIAWLGNQWKLMGMVAAGTMPAGDAVDSLAQLTVLLTALSI